MSYFTSKIYSLKRDILNFTNKVSRKLSKPDRKFTADITYGMLASGSCLLTDVADNLHEDSKKVNIVDRLSKHLNQGIPKDALSSYLSLIRKWVPKEPVIHIDDSDVVKPGGYKFESLGIVRDGSESTKNKNVYKKGYHVTELYDPKAFFTHAALLRQGSPHCAIFPTAASRRSLGRVSVPVWPITLSGRLPIVALVGRYPTN
jgi:hypothetical protein